MEVLKHHEKVSSPSSTLHTVYGDVGITSGKTQGAANAISNATDTILNVIPTRSKFSLQATLENPHTWHIRSSRRKTPNSSQQAIHLPLERHKAVVALFLPRMQKSDTLPVGWLARWNWSLLHTPSSRETLGWDQKAQPPRRTRFPMINYHTGDYLPTFSVLTLWNLNLICNFCGSQRLVDRVRDRDGIGYSC